MTGPGDTIRPDDVVVGTAAQLRAMAATLERGDATARQRAARVANARMATFTEAHPGAEPVMLIGRVLYEAVADQPRTSRVYAVTSGDEVDIFVSGYITAFPWYDDEVSAKNVRDALTAAGGKPVRVHINSGGGDYFEGQEIAAAIRDYAGSTYAAVDGLAASAASVVAIAADTVGMRTGSMLMIHEASSFAYGNAADMLAAAAMLDAVSAEIAELYAEHTGAEPAAMRELMLAETWMGPARALELGFIDEKIAAADDGGGDDPDAAEEDEDDEDDPPEDPEEDPAEDDPDEDDEDEEDEDEGPPPPPQNRHRRPVNRRPRPTPQPRPAAGLDPAAAIRSAFAKAGTPGHGNR